MSCLASLGKRRRSSSVEPTNTTSFMLDVPMSHFCDTGVKARSSVATKLAACGRAQRGTAGITRSRCGARRGAQRRGSGTAGTSRTPCSLSVTTATIALEGLRAHQLGHLMGTASAKAAGTGCTPTASRDSRLRTQQTVWPDRSFVEGLVVPWLRMEVPGSSITCGRLDTALACRSGSDGTARSAGADSVLVDDRLLFLYDKSCSQRGVAVPLSHADRPVR